VFAAEPALPSAEGQAGDAGGRDSADRRRQTEGLCLAVEFGPENVRTIRAPGSTWVLFMRDGSIIRPLSQTALPATP